MSTRRAVIWTIIAVLVGLIWGLAGKYGWAHEHMPGETKEQARVIEWLKTWKRPKGPYNIVHRQSSCCFISGMQQDCFAVKETRRFGSVIEVFPDVEGNFGYAQWYTVPPSVSEFEQPDPRESPDGRSYVCIAGNNVICYQPGGGT